jgi:two-component system, NarL family, response regulator NreC
MVSPPKNKASVVLIDDHPVALAVACEIMKDEFEILATGVNGDAALHAVSVFSPDIIVLDIGMPGKDGFETAREVRKRAPTTRILFLTAMEDVDYACAARDMGGSYVTKRRMRTDLLTAAREAMEGNLFFSPILPSQSLP